MAKTYLEYISNGNKNVFSFYLPVHMAEKAQYENCTQQNIQLLSKIRIWAVWCVFCFVLFFDDSCISNLLKSRSIVFDTRNLNSNVIQGKIRYQIP